MITAGLALVQDDRILLVHPTGYRNRRTWSIPKGHSESRETVDQTARRELEEEVGIRVLAEALEGRPWQIDRKREPSLFFWIVGVEGIPTSLPAAWLQLEEVDAARFVRLDKAAELIEPWQLPILRVVERS